MQHKKPWAALALAAALLLSALAGCGGPGPSDSGGTKELVFAANGGEGMDPANGYQGWACIRNGVGETLFRLTDELEAEPWLVEDCALSADQLTWTLTLREGITFQNGRAMDAQAVLDCLERTADMNDRAANDLMIASMAADGLTLSITTTAPNPVLPNSLCDPYGCIIDVAAGEDFSTHPVGTGPYMVESYLPDQETVVVPYDGYWNGTPKLERIRIVAMDGDTMALALQTGEIDAAYAMAYEGQALFRDNPDYSLQTVATSRIYKLYYNFHNQHLANPNVRKALNMLVDKASYGAVAMSGFGSAATGCFPENTPYSQGLTATGFDVEGARALLAAEGYADTDGDGILDKDGDPLSFSLVTYSSRAELPALSAAFQSQCGQVGIDVSVTVSESVDDLLKADQFDIAAYAFVTLPTGDPSSYLNTVMGAGGWSNFGHYENPDIQALLGELNHTFDPAERAALAAQIVQHALDDDAYCFMDHLEMSLVTKVSVTGLTPHPSDYYQITVDTDLAA